MRTPPPREWPRRKATGSTRRPAIPRKGKIKAAVGKAVGDAKLESEGGKADKIEGKVQNAVGGLKDAIRGK